MIEWQTGEYPAQICGFLDLTQLRESVKLSNGTYVQNGVWAVIESCDYVNIEDGQRKSEMFTQIIMETQQINPSLQKFYLVDVETFKSPLVVIPNIGTKHEYLMMTPRAQWGPDFAHWIMQPHVIDEAEKKENSAPELDEQPKQPKKKKKKAAKKAAIGHAVVDSESGSDSSSPDS
jgi:hypothetical protein